MLSIFYVETVCASESFCALGEWPKPYLGETIGRYCRDSAWPPQVLILRAHFKSGGFNELEERHHTDHSNCIRIVHHRRGSLWLWIVEEPEQDQFEGDSDANVSRDAGFMASASSKCRLEITQW